MGVAPIGKSECICFFQVYPSQVENFFWDTSISSLNRTVVKVDSKTHRVSQIGLLPYNLNAW